MSDNEDRLQEKTAARAKKESALEATRKRFISLIGTSLGASLAGCGYGFVPSNTTSPTDPLTVPMNDALKRGLKFFTAAQDDPTLQEQFIQNPSATLIGYGVAEPNTKAEVSKANRLLFYMLKNKGLANRCASIATSASGMGRAVKALENEFTGSNPNIKQVRAAIHAINTASDKDLVIERQVEVLMSDETFRDIAGVHLEANEISPYSRRLAARVGNLETEKPNTIPFFNFALNVNFILNANFFSNANFNLNANFNQDTNTGECFMIVCRQSSISARMWSDFLARLVEQSERISGQ